MITSIELYDSDDVLLARCTPSSTPGVLYEGVVSTTGIATRFAIRSTVPSQRAHGSVVYRGEEFPRQLWVRLDIPRGLISANDIIKFTEGSIHSDDPLLNRALNRTNR